MPNENSSAKPQQANRHTSLGEHIEDLRSHLIRIGLALAVAIGVTAYFYTDLWGIAMLPRESAAKLMGVDASTTFPLQLIGPAEGISIVAGLCFKVSIGLLLPFIFYELWNFIAPGLRDREKRAIRWILMAGTLLFFAGVLVAFFIALPTGLKFLISFDSTLTGTVTEWRVGNYFSLLTMACFGFGICFETPLVMLSLTIAGIITPSTIKKYWRHATIIISILGALFTPPDPLTMIMLAGSMLLLFFLGYYLSKIAYQKKIAHQDFEHIEEDLGED